MENQEMRPRRWMTRLVRFLNFLGRVLPVSGRWPVAKSKMKTNDIESICSEGHLMEIRLSKIPGKWHVRTTCDGQLRESYRPLTREEVIEIVESALNDPRQDRLLKAPERASYPRATSSGRIQTPQCECQSQEASS